MRRQKEKLLPFHGGQNSKEVFLNFLVSILGLKLPSQGTEAGSREMV